MALFLRLKSTGTYFGRKYAILSDQESQSVILYTLLLPLDFYKIEADIPLGFHTVTGLDSSSLYIRRLMNLYS